MNLLNERTEGVPILGTVEHIGKLDQYLSDFSVGHRFCKCLDFVAHTSSYVGLEVHEEWIIYVPTLT